MILGFQDTPAPRSFDPDIVWQVFIQEGVLNEPAPSILVAELAPSSVNFNIFFWTDSRQATVLTVIDSAMTRIKLALDEAGINIPYPHTVVLTQGPATPRDGASPENY